MRPSVTSGGIAYPLASQSPLSGSAVSVAVKVVEAGAGSTPASMRSRLEATTITPNRKAKAKDFSTADLCVFVRIVLCFSSSLLREPILTLRQLGGG